MKRPCIRRLRRKRAEHAARPIVLNALHMTGLYDKRDHVAESLTLLDLKRLEIARALGSEPNLLPAR
jgi:branched-chain amino acid transport system ATP-binding protein